MHKREETTENREEIQMRVITDEHDIERKQDTTNRKEDRLEHIEPKATEQDIKKRKERSHTERKGKAQDTRARQVKKLKQSSIKRYMNRDGKRKRKREQAENRLDKEDDSSDHMNERRKTGKARRNEPSEQTDQRDMDQRDTDQRDTDQCDQITRRRKETKETTAKERTGIG